MEKTFEYAINEAHKMGWQSARLSHSFNPMAMRELIAQEIDATKEKYSELAKDKENPDRPYYIGFCNGLFFASLIARDVKDRREDVKNVSN
jgi:AAA15 family ATPase/GTPase